MQTYKKVFFITALSLLILSVSIVSATNDTNTDSSTNDASSIEHTNVQKDTKVVKETSKSNIKTNKEVKNAEKQIIKENKTDENKKSDSITIDGVEYAHTYYDLDIIDDEIIVEENTFYNHCSFNNEEGYMENYATVYLNNTLAITTGRKNFMTCNEEVTSKMIINNSIIQYLTNRGEIFIYNSTLNDYLQTWGNSRIFIDELTTLGSNFKVYQASVATSKGTIYTNNTEVIKYFEEMNIQGMTIISGDGSGNNEDYNIIIENQTITTSTQNNENLTYINCTLNSNVDNSGNLTLMNSTLNSYIKNNGNLIIDDKCILGENLIIENNGEIICNNTYALIPYSTVINGNYTIENINWDKNLTNKGNLTLTNSNISAKITNQGNLTLINCSLSNNNLTTTDSKTDGFLLENKGNLTMIDCVVENNTFNSSASTNQLNQIQLYGAMVNNGFMKVVNSSFDKNKVGYVNIYDTLLHADVIGYGAVITNTGTLIIERSTFINGYAAGSGGAITNKGNLTINNTIFSNNTVNTAGSAICNDVNSFSDIYNTEFVENYVNLTYNNVGISGGGAIADSGTITWETSNNITNCTFKNNHGEFTGNQDLAGVSGSGGAILIYTNTYNIQDSRFINNNISNGKRGYSPDRTSILSNCLLENSQIIDNIGLNIINNTFKDNSGITVNIDSMYYNRALNRKIIGNYFTDNDVTTYYSGLNQAPNTITLKYSPDWDVSKEEFLNTINLTIADNIYKNTSIHDEIQLNLPQKIYTGEPITITGIYTLLEPENYDADILEQTKFNVYINGELVDTIDTLEFTITPSAGTMMVTIQPTISQTRKTQAIRATTLLDVIITPENYNEYIHEGALVGVSKDSKILFQGTFTDKGKIFIDTSDIIIDGTNATFTNTMFILEASGITLQNMKINNTQTEYPIQNSKDNNIITGNTITLTNTEGRTAAIYNKASNTEITYNTLYIDGPATDIDHSEGYGIANTQAILLIGGDNNKVEYNTVKVTTTVTSTQFGTTEAITNHKEATNTIISNNNITLTGNANFKYGINSLNNVENITITNNNIQVSGERYTDGIQIGTGANNILIKNNTIKCVCQNTTPVDQEAITYGITTVTVGEIISNNITIQDNNIDLTGTANYGIELYTTNNTLVENNTINVNGPQSMGIGLAHSPNSTIIGNNIKTSGDSTIPLGTVTEEIQPANAGIQVQQDSNNILIQDNTIQTYDKAGKDNCINITTNNVTVKDNNLTSSNKVGNNTITTTQPDTTIEDNSAIEQNSTTQTTTEDLTIGDSTTITAQFYDETYTPVGDGKAIFRVNGKTLRYDNGEVIFADVINGRAELPNVNIIQEWMKPDTTIQAVYLGDNNNEPIITEKTPINVTKPEATISLEVPKEVIAGQEITLKANVTDGDNAISSGRVAFKLNGKTLKNAEGKALYANVENGIATLTYTIPEKTKAKEYVLTAVFTDTKYDRKEANSTLNVVKV